MSARPWASVLLVLGVLLGGAVSACAPDEDAVDPGSTATETPAESGDAGYGES